VNTAHLETTKTTHLVIWIGENPVKAASGRWSYEQIPVTLCGRQKRHLSKSVLKYNLQPEELKYPLCKVCEAIVEELMLRVSTDARF